jgi:hypothetical protein
MRLKIREGGIRAEPFLEGAFHGEEKGIKSRINAILSRGER